MSREELERMANGVTIMEILPNPSDQNDYQTRMDSLSDRHDDVMRGRSMFPGIRVTQRDDFGSFKVSQTGECPQLQDDNRCAIYERRPQLCANLPVGGEECNKRRKKDGLPAIRPDGTVIPSETFRQRTARIINTFSARFRKS